MRQYELVAVFPIEEDQHKAGREKLLADLSAASVQVEKTDEMGDRDFAYEIDKRRRGKYVLFTINAEPQAVTTLDKAFKLNANLIRYLIVTPERRK
ncbi:MAG: 30S ribosomal protein S6 [Spirochaetaceae bacterium]|jgi:small subunit ribosomal protein S6|nr:30S ribosomal protein S6 [Spirochaetaceae bacterium]